MLLQGKLGHFYIAIAIKKVAPMTTPIDTPRAEAPLIVEVVEVATLAAVVDVPIWVGPWSSTNLSDLWR